MVVFVGICFHWPPCFYSNLSVSQSLSPSISLPHAVHQAKFAFEGCLKCPTLPTDKKPQVEEELQTCKNALMQMTGCGQQ
jgi:hypothetical protein